jgi:hypothetical protein
LRCIVTSRAEAICQPNALEVKDTVEGVSLNAGYKFWKQIGITERQDNNTIRVVLGNDVAIKAIADKHINKEVPRMRQF